MTPANRQWNTFDPEEDDDLVGDQETTATPAEDLFVEVGGRGCPFVLAAYHRDGVRVLHLTSDNSLVVGRSSEADVVLPDSMLSRRHARFEYRAGRVWVQDLNSTNGTRVNGAEIGRDAAARMRGVPVSIKVGDAVSIGNTTFALHPKELFDETQGGLDSHDRFVGVLADEVLRSKTFGHQLGLLLVGGFGEEAHVSNWSPRVRQLLRLVDRVALYSADTLEAAIVETNVEELHELGQRLVAEGKTLGTELRVGAALYPRHATDSEELIECARLAMRSACSTDRLRFAPEVGGAEPPTAHLVDEAGGPIVRSPEMVDIYQTVRRVAGSVIPILIEGETGTGKEVVAQAIHGAGPRRDRPLRCVNCAAIPEQLVESILFGHERGAFTGATAQNKGVFETADGGTVFLDELGELPLAAQAALLRVLETKRFCRVGSTREISVDVRVVAATNRDLEAEVAAGRFRQDLLYRLNAITLALPPLRDRVEEIIPLANCFMKQAAEANGVTVTAIDSAAQRCLTFYRWPGNVRELRNVVERAVVIASTRVICPEDLPDKLREDRVQQQPPQPPRTMGLAPLMTNPGIAGAGPDGVPAGALGAEARDGAPVDLANTPPAHGRFRRWDRLPRAGAGLRGDADQIFAGAMRLEPVRGGATVGATASHPGVQDKDLSDRPTWRESGSRCRLSRRRRRER